MKWIESPTGIGCLGSLFVVALLMVMLSYWLDSRPIVSQPEQVAAVQDDPTVTSAAPTDTPLPTETDVPPTETPLPTATALTPTNTPVPSTETPVPFPTNTLAPAPQPVATEAAVIVPAPQQSSNVGVGTPVRVGDVEWTVLEVTERGNLIESDDFLVSDWETFGKFVQVRYQYINRGTNSLTYGGVALFDNQGREYSENPDSVWYVDSKESCTFLDNVLPGIPNVCVEIFEIAPDSSGLTLEVGDMRPFFDDTARIILGL